MTGPLNSGPRGPTSLSPRNGRRLSERGMFSLLMMMASLSALGIALISGAWLVLDILGVGLQNSLSTLPAKALVIGLAYVVGWITALVAIRVYSNLVLPFIINYLIWGCLIGVCALYVIILQRLFDQNYDLLRFWAYLVIVAAGLSATVGLHLIIEDHKLRPLSIPLLIISMIHLGLIVIRYVFSDTAKLDYLWKDLFFFFTMGLFAFLMLAHMGLLDPLRTWLTYYFDRNSRVIRTED
jgi:hypothetical protein